MNVDHETILPEYPLYENDLDSPEEVELDYGYHSIGKNIEVNKPYMLLIVAMYIATRFKTVQQYI